MSQQQDRIPLCVAHETHHEIIDRIELPDDEHFFDPMDETDERFKDILEPYQTEAA